jgi:hypothetical protein
MLNSPCCAPTWIKDLVDAWKTATNVLAFVKWLAGIGTAAAFLWAAIKAKFGV